MVGESKPPGDELVTFSGPGRDSAAEGDGPKPAIKGYEVIDKLGEGGMGTVWRAIQVGTHREVALKVTNAWIFGSRRALARFEREVELAARLEHPNIARVYDSGVHERNYYYAMELIAGQPLDEYARAHRLTCRHILALMSAVCSGVQCAHQRGIIHRDLKPSNILVAQDGQPRVLDFGLAKDVLAEHTDGAVSLDGDIVGTPAYMSPEQAAGRHEDVGTRSDVYSLGMILYHLLTDQWPYDISGSRYEVLRNIQEQEPQRPSGICPSVQRDLEAILLKCLEKDPDKRYQSVLALHEDIQNWLDGRPVAARSVSTWYLVGKLVMRYRAATAIVCLLAVILLANGYIGVSSLVKARHMQQEMDRRQKAHDRDSRERELLLREAAFGLFLEQWHARMPTAQDLLFYLSEQSREARAAHFLLDDERSFAEKRQELPDSRIEGDEAFWHFIFAEHHLRDNRPQEALMAYKRARDAMSAEPQSARLLQRRVISRIETLENQKVSGSASH